MPQCAVSRDGLLPFAKCHHSCSKFKTRRLGDKEYITKMINGTAQIYGTFLLVKIRNRTTVSIPSTQEGYDRPARYPANIPTPPNSTRKTGQGEAATKAGGIRGQTNST